MFLTESVKESSRWISPVSSEQLYIKNQFCVKVDCSIHPRPLIVNFDSGLVNRDPRRLRRRRVANAICVSVNPLTGRLMRAFYAE